MCRRHPIVPVRGTTDPVQVFYSGCDDSINPVSYIVCLYGRVPKRYKVWSLNAQGVREVHPFARIRLLDEFREDNFKTFFFNSQRCCIPFISQISLNGSVKFIRFTNVTSDTEVVIFLFTNGYQSYHALA